ncbi:MAG: metal ABC transporter permease, partial [Pseudomonadota bacterium]
MARRKRRTTTAGTPELSILSRAVPDIWPASRPDLRLRVVASLTFLILAKISTLTTPFFFGWAVDGIGPEGNAALAWAPAALVAAYV